MQPDAQNKALLPELAPKRATAAEFYLTLRRTTCFSNCSPVSSITLNGSLTVIYPSGNLCPATILAVHFSSVAESCPTPCDPMNRSTPGLPVHYSLENLKTQKSRPLTKKIKYNPQSHNILPQMSRILTKLSNHNQENCN